MVRIPSRHVRWIGRQRGRPGARVAPGKHGVAWTSMPSRDSTRRQARQVERDRLRIASQYALRLQEDIESERRRIACALHDDLGQRLAVLAMDAAELRTTPLTPLQRQLVDQIRAVVREATESMRGIVAGIRPLELESIGLQAALQNLLQRWGRRLDIVCTLQADAALDALPGELSAAVYRIVQEGLNNIAKHAHALSMQLVVRCEARQLVLELRDDGVGMCAADALGRPGHFGLFGIDERVRQLGGRFELDSEPGHGTTLRIRLPRRLADQR